MASHKKYNNFTKEEINKEFAVDNDNIEHNLPNILHEQENKENQLLANTIQKFMQSFLQIKT